jgi:hypothetical protein
MSNSQSAPNSILLSKDPRIAKVICRDIFLLVKAVADEVIYLIYLKKKKKGG